MQHIWPTIQNHIRAQIDERTWDQFFRHMILLRFAENEALFELPDEFFVTWFENNYRPYLTDLFREIGGRPIELRFLPRGQRPVEPTNDTMSFAPAHGKQPHMPMLAPLHAPYANAQSHAGHYYSEAPSHRDGATYNESAQPQAAPAAYNHAPASPAQPEGHYAQPNANGAGPQPWAYPAAQQGRAPVSSQMFAQAAHHSAAYPMPSAFPPPPEGHNPHAAQVFAAPPLSLNERIVQAGLNPRYTFDNYVVGPSNQFCYAACSAVGERPAMAYNPLFLYGGVGLGKTHLLHAVGIEIMRRFPGKRVTYVTSEAFMNDLIHSLRNKDTNSFRGRFRDECDVLLMDDIQFIAGKNSTQEEFFHTFNALHQAHKQIVITSDQMPQELPGLEERLRSRFAWGLIADVQPPEIETRIAIIRKKAEVESMNLDDDVAMFLATHIRSNIRELEGSLIKLKASASLFHREITIDFAKDQLRGVIQERNQHVTIDRIQKLVANFYNVKVKDIVGKRRHRVIAHPRHVAMYLSRKHTTNSFPEIGKNFGGRDHSTVMNAVKKIEGLVDGDDDVLIGEISSLERSIMR